MEQTFIMIKPDGVKRRLVGEIISRFERCGYVLVAIKTFTPTKEVLEAHCAEHKGKGFYDSLMGYLGSGKVVAMVWAGSNAVKGCRKLVGETDPAVAQAGTIRGDFGLVKGRNLIHGSDSVESAKNEIKAWFGQEFEVEMPFDYSVIYE